MAPDDSTYYLARSKYAVGLALDYYESLQIPDVNVRKIIKKCRDCHNAFGTPEAKAAIEAAKQAGLDYVNDPATQAIPEHIRKGYDTLIETLYTIVLAAYWGSVKGDFDLVGYTYSIIGRVLDISPEIAEKMDMWEKERGLRQDKQ